MSLLNELRIGTEVLIDKEKRGNIIGWIEYVNPKDDNKKWREYRVKTETNEIVWLSIDEEYQEYSISFPSGLKDGKIDSSWHKVDEGIQVVRVAKGDVDVEIGDQADFAEFEDETEEKTLSLEMWEDETEVSEGYYLDPEEIEILSQGNFLPQAETSSAGRSGLALLKIWLWISLMVTAVYIGLFALVSVISPEYPVEEYLKKNSAYEFVTSITGNQEQKANVYRLKSEQVLNKEERSQIEHIAKAIIKAIEGNTETVTEQKEEGILKSISIVTRKEYSLIYYSEDEKEIFIQVSDRKYNYTSDQKPYRSGRSTAGWYRMHYYSSSYKSDVETWRATPSAYQTYNGPIMHDLGNGYYDIYSGNIRQESIRNRRSSDGGVHRGK